MLCLHFCWLFQEPYEHLCTIAVFQGFLEKLSESDCLITAYLHKMIRQIPAVATLHAPCVGSSFSQGHIWVVSIWVVCDQIF